MKQFLENCKLNQKFKIHCNTHAFQKQDEPKSRKMFSMIFQGMRVTDPLPAFKKDPRKLYCLHNFDTRLMNKLIQAIYSTMTQLIQLKQLNSEPVNH